MQSDTPSGDRVRVLLADDNQAILDRAAAALTPDFLVVGSVNTGPAAVEAAVSLGPDVIVLDISMPGMSGLEVATRLRKAGSKAAVVFLTCHRGQEFVEAAMAVGAVGYVVKTRLASDLILAVRDACDGRPFVSRLT